MPLKAIEIQFNHLHVREALYDRDGQFWRVREVLERRAKVRVTRQELEGLQTPEPC